MSNLRIPNKPSTFLPLYSAHNQHKLPSTSTGVALRAADRAKIERQVLEFRMKTAEANLSLMVH